MIIFFDGPTDAPQMPPEGVWRVSCAPGQVVIESDLLAQCLALPDPASLVPLALPDLVRGGQHLLDALCIVSFSLSITRRPYIPV
jgi:hypothetical protein